MESYAHESLFVLKTLSLVQVSLQALSDHSESFLFNKVSSFNEQTTIPSSLFMQVSKLANLPAILASVNVAIEKSSQLSLATIADVAMQIMVLFLKLDLVGS